MTRRKAYVAGFCVTVAAAGAAHAESNVTLYGVLDSGILYKTQSAPGGSAWQLATGAESTNRWGIQGAEDLGGGLQATFALESGFRISNGTFINGGQPATAGTVLFDRGATVGLKSQQFGALLVGKNRSPFYTTLVDIDVTGYSNFGSLNNIIYQNLSGFTGWQYQWVDNSVMYQMPEIYGLRGSAMYSFGGVAGNFQAKRVVSAALSWRVGDLLVGGAYFSGNDPTGATDKTAGQAYTVGANYQLYKFRFAFDFANFRNIAKASNVDFYTGEITYQPTAFWKFAATYIKLSDQLNAKRDGNLYKLGGQYLLSKRTSLYADVGYVKNSSLGSFGLQNSTPIGVVGKNQFGCAAGIRHTF
ncbi:MAG TPA: porin [Trinickia sp.]|nr:porin [Trinickia sp.]